MDTHEISHALNLARRDFFRTAAVSAGAVSLGLAAAPARATSANEKIVMGSIGCGGQGSNLSFSFAKQPEVELACICDVDESRAQAAAAELEKITGRRPRIVKDLRQVLDDKSIDAVTVGTPDHWHAPATILACDAKKHVYVEKPCAHNIREGRLMIEAARRNQRVVQVGTQSRSGEHIQQAMKLLHEGAIGKVLVAKAWNSQRRGDIGHAQPSEAPGGVDYDLWLGPAPAVPFQANRFHYGWHWWYDFGTGDMGNDGIHEIDIARWGLGVDTHPSRIAALGGKLYFDDDQQFPDTQYVVFEWPAEKVGDRRELLFEMRIWSPYKQEGHENGNAFYGTDGMLVLGKATGWQLFGPKNQPREAVKGSLSGGTAHHRNFLECIQSGDKPNADIEIGHLSSSLCHLGNIACRVGRQLSFDPAHEQIIGDDEAHRLVGRSYRPDHWAIPSGA